MPFAYAVVIPGCALGLLVAGLWLWRRQRLATLEWCMLACATGATLGSIDLLPGYLVSKPLTMIIAIVYIAITSYSTGANRRFYALLLGALLFSLSGDVWLMLAGDYFIAGLASFLVAHVFYIALFHQGQRWFPNRKALLGVLGFGAVMLGVLWSSLGDPMLKGAVTAYVSVISLMAAQALGRAGSLGTAAARHVALGACVFMVSDTLIAVNKFLMPLPLSSLWILVTYYAAQMLIVHYARPTPQRTGAP